MAVPVPRASRGRASGRAPPGSASHDHRRGRGAGRDADAGTDTEGCHPLEHALHGPRTGLTQSAVSRIWRAFALQPHRSETFNLSSDPLFKKVRDIVGLYLNPPERALVLCVDEKSQIPGPGPKPAAASHASGTDRASNPRLCPPRHHLPLRGPEYEDRCGPGSSLDPLTDAIASPSALRLDQGPQDPFAVATPLLQQPSRPGGRPLRPRAPRLRGCCRCADRGGGPPSPRRRFRAPRRAAHRPDGRRPSRRGPRPHRP